MRIRESGTNEAGDTGRKAHSGGPSKARTGIETLELRLRGLMGALAEGLRDIGERLPPGPESGGTEISRRSRLGTVAARLGPSMRQDRSLPDHSIQQGDAAWTREAHLPGVTLHELRIDPQGGRLTLGSPWHPLSCSLPEDLRTGTLRMIFYDGRLTLDHSGAETPT
ncbi:hypothetical protein CLG85_023685 [Yangia mangrovi]|uniref:Uncharacterized protein n=1 Tax=Alloyangia mangrovi TaxID=1779329 RepID=A0ABT2KUE3_9RHOB|nr:hypothetical protein [Alloyangia mangrovi]MCT4373132.1 hypothetical protein [Alloyangia mangrovi]